MLHPYHIIIVTSLWILKLALEPIICSYFPAACISVVKFDHHSRKWPEQHKGDLILIVDDLYQVDALELTHILRERDTTTPIIVLSDDRFIEAPIKEAGAWFLLRKPGVARELQQLLPRLLPLQVEQQPGLSVQNPQDVETSV